MLQMEWYKRWNGSVAVFPAMSGYLIAEKPLSQSDYRIIPDNINRH